ncbi:MAG TPA: L,D-transpeptidase [Ramlibacter sp.]|nr:L,D-transpeptidase [Ramlibacter sp.]
MLRKAVTAALFALVAASAGATPLAGETRELHDWVIKARDHEGRPFAIVDKKNARMFVFDSAGRVQGTSTVLLGAAVGDDIAPNVGAHAQQGYVPFKERTTPAGRFASEPGINLSGEHVIWVDYASAFAIHRLRPGASHAARQAKLATPDPSQHRASYGCVVVPVKFYEDVVQRWLGKSRTVVYVLPEQTSAREIFNSL